MLIRKMMLKYTILPALARPTSSLSACLLATVLLVGPSVSESNGRERAATTEQLAEIEAASTVEQLIELGKSHRRRRKYDAARKCVDKIVKLEPSLLTDSKPQTPNSWNEFWFAYRAELQTQKLRADDAEARVKLAKWMHESEATGPACEMVLEVLEIDPSLSEARTLAEEWKVFESGPTQLDLRYGLAESLFPESLSDENEELVPREGRKFLLLPLAYEPRSRRLTITKSQMTVRSDEGRPCSVKGMVLLLGSRTGTAGRGKSDSLVIDLKRQGNNEPFWERIQVLPETESESESEDGEIELTCYNTSQPIVRPKPGERRGASRGRSSHARSSRSDRRTETRSGSGHLAFVVEIPESTKYIECGLRGQTPTRLEMDFLTVLGQQSKDLSSDEQDHLVNILSAQVSSLDSPIASAAVLKLVMIRSELTDDRQQATGKSDELERITAAIDRTLLTALGSVAPRVRKETFEGLIATPTPLDRSTLETMARFEKADTLIAMLDQINELLASLEPEKDEISHEFRRSTGGAAEAIALAVESLPTSRASQNVFDALKACLKHPDLQVYTRAIDIVLANGVRQSLATLTELSDAARDELIQRLPSVEDLQLKTVILRLLLIRTSPDSLSKVLRAFGVPPLTVTSVDDPLLAVFRGYVPDSALPPLLDLLSQADLTAVQGTNELNRVLETLPVEQRDNPRLQSAILRLATLQFIPAYQAPIPRDRQARYGSRSEDASGFEALLASIAASPSSDDKAARTATASLLAAGQIHLLNDRLARTKSDRRQQNLIQSFAKDEKLWQREALPIFLASRLSGKNKRTLYLALAALQAKSDAIKPSWRFNLAVRQGIDPTQLVRLTLHEDEKIARVANKLVQRLARFSDAEKKEFYLLGSPEARLDHLKRIDQQRIKKPVGEFACVVYLDVTSTGVSTRSTGRSSEGKTSIVRRNVPLTSSTVMIQSLAQAGVQIIADGRRIGLSGMSVGTKRSSRSDSATLNIDAGSLLQSALVSSGAKKEGLTAKAYRHSLTNVLRCELKYEKWGAWFGEITVSRGRSSSEDEGTWEATGAKIILEPLVR